MRRKGQLSSALFGTVNRYSFEAVDDEYLLGALF